MPPPPSTGGPPVTNIRNTSSLPWRGWLNLDLLHEIKYGGYWLRLEREGVRLITKGGYNWTDRYPQIVEAVRTVLQKQFVLDGEGC